MTLHDLVSATLSTELGGFWRVESGEQYEQCWFEPGSDTDLYGWLVWVVEMVGESCEVTVSLEEGSPTLSCTVSSISEAEISLVGPDEEVLLNLDNQIG